MFASVIVIKDYYPPIDEGLKVIHDLLCDSLKTRQYRAFAQAFLGDPDHVVGDNIGKGFSKEQ
jgi:hypothetical protein